MKYEEMRIDDYLSLIHQNDRDIRYNEIQQKVIRGVIKTEKHFQDIMNKDMRVNESAPEIGKLSPIRRTIESKDAGDIVSHHIISIVQVMITE